MPPFEVSGASAAPTALPDWYEADEAYLAHHVACHLCVAAGKNSHLARCTVGAALWERYQQAGEPPHFLWLKRKSKSSAGRAA